MLQRASNKYLLEEVFKAANICYLKNSTVNDLPELEKYFKYKIILLDEYYVESEIVLYKNKDASYVKKYLFKPKF